MATQQGTKWILIRGQNGYSTGDKMGTHQGIKWLLNMGQNGLSQGDETDIRQR
jgi:hypothetical protein